MAAIRMFAFLSVVLLFTSGACRADLLEAAKQGDAEAVRAALAAGVPADVRDREGRTPLHLAAQAGHTDVIQLLLDAGAAVDAEDRDFGSKPLYYAAVGAHVSVAKLLLERGALVDATNHTRDPVSAGSHHSDYTALDQASEDGHADLVALLLDHGADVNGRANGISPLLLAVAPGHVEVARMLLDHGADVSAKDWAGASLLHLTGKPDLVKLLLDRGADKEARDDAGRTPLHVTAVMAWLEAATTLLDSGADVNARDRQGWTPLHYTALASRKGKSFCLDLTRMLLRYGADPGRVTETAIRRSILVQVARRGWRPPLYYSRLGLTWRSATTRVIPCFTPPSPSGASSGPSCCWRRGRTRGSETGATRHRSTLPLGMTSVTLQIASWITVPASTIPLSTGIRRFTWWRREPPGYPTVPLCLLSTAISPWGAIGRRSRSAWATSMCGSPQPGRRTASPAPRPRPSCAGGRR